jgi:replicative DNA helicase
MRRCFCSAIFSLEMSAQQLVERLIAQVADTVASELPGDYERLRIDSQNLRLGNINDEQLHVLARASGMLSEAEIFIDESSLVTPIEIRGKARRLKAEMGGLDLIIVDYLQLMSDRAGRSENRVQEMSNISRQLKFLARELDVPVVALSQLSRAVEARTDKRPQLSDLRESGSIEQDADVVVMLFREKSYYPTLDAWQRSHPNKPYPEHIAEIIVAKHRHGPTTEFNMFFDEKRAKFKDLAVVPQ